MMMMKAAVAQVVAAEVVVKRVVIVEAIANQPKPDQGVPLSWSVLLVRLQKNSRFYRPLDWYLSDVSTTSFALVQGHLQVCWLLQI